MEEKVKIAIKDALRDDVVAKDVTSAYNFRVIS